MTVFRPSGFDHGLLMSPSTRVNLVRVFEEHDLLADPEHHGHLQGDDPGRGPPPSSRPGSAWGPRAGNGDGPVPCEDSRPLFPELRKHRPGSRGDETAGYQVLRRAVRFSTEIFFALPLGDCTVPLYTGTLAMRRAVLVPGGAYSTASTAPRPPSRPARR